MKIISLNTWGGRAGKEILLDFFSRNKEVDIFCLQEMWSVSYDDYDGVEAGGRKIQQDNVMTEGVQDIQKILKDHDLYFRPQFLENYGLAIFIKKSIEVKSEGEIFVYKEKGHIPSGDIGRHARNLQHITIKHDSESLTVFNFHGLWNGRGKGDSEDRIRQSERIVNFTNNLKSKIALLGDFNLLPETNSIKMIEESGLRNLVVENGITSTRTSFYDKDVQFADYAFVSMDLDVKDFKVLPDEVSDHAPLFLEI